MSISGEEWGYNQFDLYWDGEEDLILYWERKQDLFFIQYVLYSSCSSFETVSQYDCYNCKYTWDYFEQLNEIKVGWTTKVKELHSQILGSLQLRGVCLDGRGWAA